MADVIKRCTVEGCDRPARRRGAGKRGAPILCELHTDRLRRRGEVGPPGVLKRAGGTGSFTKDGYLIHHRNGKMVLEHRAVMERVLDRPLRPFENVHHINGIRHDNRPENLQLWVKPQPIGQRPEQLVEWVVEHYPELVRAILDKRNQLRLQI